MNNYENYFTKFVFHPAGKQKSLSGRFSAAPNFDLGKYKVSAKVDTLVLKVQLSGGKTSENGTNFSSIQSEIEKETGKILHVKPTTNDNDKKRSWNEFRITFQDPKYSKVKEVLNIIDKAFGVADFTIHQFDVALDLTPKMDKFKESELKGARLAALNILRRNFMPSIEIKDINPRFYRENLGVTDQVRKRMDINTNVIDYVGDSTMYIGDRDSPINWKIYHKTLDQIETKDGVVIGDELPKEEQCARIEVVFKGEAVKSEIGEIDLDILKANGIKRLNKHFEFLVPTVEEFKLDSTCIKSVAKYWIVDKELRVGFNNKGAWSIKHMREKGGDKSKKAGMVSYKEFNARVDYALKELKRKFFNN